MPRTVFSPLLLQGESLDCQRGSCLKSINPSVLSLWLCHICQEANVGTVEKREATLKRLLLELMRINPVAGSGDFLCCPQFVFALSSPTESCRLSHLSVLLTLLPTLQVGFCKVVILFVICLCMWELFRCWSGCRAGPHSLHPLI